MDILYWLESIRNPVLDAIMQTITYLGDELLFIVLALLVFWCVDKKEGYYLLFVGFFGTLLNQFLKLLCRVPRPWEKDPNFTIVEAARAGADGYSFPSGHTQSVTGTLGGIARWHKGKALRIVCIVFLLLTAFSRMYLGVHTPLDVGVSLVIGAILVFGFYPIVNKASEAPKKMYFLIGTMLVLSFVFVLYANLTTFPADAEWENIESGRKNSYSLFGALLGFAIAYPIEHKRIRFSTQGGLRAQLCKLILGLALLLAVKEGLKFVFSLCGLTWLWLNAVRYCAVVLFAALVWPMTFPFWTRLCAKEK